MRNIYVRRTGIKTSATRQDYLTSKSKQEHLLAYSELDLKEEFKNINKEMVIELPNELMDQHSLDNKYCWEVIGKYYVNSFKANSGYEHVAYAIHLNSSRTNLHMHLSYIDRTLDNTPKLAKRDSCIYVSTGTKLKKSDYNESNPNHLKISKGDILLDYDKVSNEQKQEWKAFMLGGNPNKAKFDLRREIKDTLQDTSNSYSNCLEGGVDPRLLKSSLNEYKELFKELNNQLLNEYGYNSKYVVGDMQELGLLPYKKVGKLVNDIPNEIQKNIINYNNSVKEFNNLVQESILDEVRIPKAKKLDLIEEIEVMKSFKPYPLQKEQEWNLLFLLRKVQKMYEALKDKIEVVLKKEYVIEEPVIEEPVIEEQQYSRDQPTNSEVYEEWLEELSKDQEPEFEESRQRRGPSLSL